MESQTMNVGEGSRRGFGTEEIREHFETCRGAGGHCGARQTRPLKERIQVPDHTQGGRKEACPRSAGQEEELTRR